MLTPRGRRLVWIAAIVALAFIAIFAFHALVADQTPRIVWDSSAYLETARQPFSVWHFFYPKPVMVPVLYRALDSDPEAIVAFQEVLAFVSWTALAAVVALIMRRPRARVAGAVAALLFLFHPARVGFCDAILSESINDSLMALVVAAVLAATLVVARSGYRALVIAIVVLAAAWILAHDINAMIVIAAIACCVWSWRKQLRTRAWELAAAALLLAVAVFALWSTSVAPPPTQLTFQRGWPESFLARSSYPTLDVVFDRVLSDPDGAAFLADHGLPQVEQVVELVSRNNRLEVIENPSYAAAAAWIATHGRAVYVSWLAHHPLRRLGELTGALRTLAGINTDQYRVYMPPGWHSGGPRTWIANRFVVGALGVLWIVACWRRRNRVTRLAMGLVIAGLAGSITAFYGDSLEIARHCYESGQLIVLGFALATVGLLDRRDQ